MIIDKDKVKV